MRLEDLRGPFKAFEATQKAIQPRTNRSQEKVPHTLSRSAGDTQPETHQGDTTATPYHVVSRPVASSHHLLSRIGNIIHLVRLQTRYDAARLSSP